MRSTLPPLRSLADTTQPFADADEKLIQRSLATIVSVAAKQSPWQAVTLYEALANVMQFHEREARRRRC